MSQVNPTTQPELHSHGLEPEMSGFHLVGFEFGLNITYMQFEFGFGRNGTRSTTQFYFYHLPSPYKSGLVGRNFLFSYNLDLRIIT